MDHLDSDIAWFVSLYEGHFGRKFPGAAYRLLQILADRYRLVFGEHYALILLYIITRGWNRNDADAIVAFLDDIVKYASDTSVLRRIWECAQKRFPAGPRDEDRRIRAVGEYLLVSVQSKRMIAEDGCSWVETLSDVL